MISKLLARISKNNKFLKVIAIVAITIIPYSNTFFWSFVGDDPSFIVKWEQIKPPVQFVQLLKGQVPSEHQGTYRPLRSLYYVITQTIFHENPTYYHIFALSIYIICTLLVYKLVKQLGRNENVAFITTILFATHPIHTESISFITTSFDIVGIIWGILAILFYTQPKRNLIQYALSLCFFILAIFSYEITLIIPIILLFYHLLLDEKKFSLGLKMLPLIPFFYFIIFYFFIRINLLAIPSRGGYINNNPLLSLQFSLKQIPIYLSEVFIPYHIGLDHFIPPDIHTYNLPQYLASSFLSIQAWDLYGIISIFLLLIYLMSIFKLRKRNGLISFLLAWILISLLPILNIFPGYLIMFEKYLFFGSIASCFIVAILLDKIKFIKIKKIALLWLILIPILIIFITLTFIRNFDWKTDVSLWQATARQSPNNAMVWYQLGSAYQQQQQYENAIRAYQKAISLNDSMYFVHTNLGISYYLINDPQNATAQLEIAINQFQKAKEAYLYLAKIYLDYQDFGKAIKYLSDILDLEPEFSEAKDQLLETYNSLGNLLSKTGQYQPAREAYQKALDIDPNYQPALINLDQISKYTNN